MAVTPLPNSYFRQEQSSNIFKVRNRYISSTYGCNIPLGHKLTHVGSVFGPNPNHGHPQAAVTPGTSKKINRLRIKCQSCLTNHGEAPFTLPETIFLWRKNCLIQSTRILEMCLKKLPMCFNKMVTAFESGYK